MYGEVIDKVELFPFTKGISTTLILMRVNYYGENNIKTKKLGQLLIPLILL